MLLKKYKGLDDLPIINWFKVHNEEDYGYLVVNRDELEGDFSSEDMIDLLNLWDVFNNEFINRFGLSDEFEMEMEVRNNIAIYQADWIITKDNYYKTLIKVEEARLNMFTGEIREMEDLERTLVKMSKHYGFKLESKGLSTSQYYSYLYEIIDGKEVSK